jgi:hypothetical protein
VYSVREIWYPRKIRLNRRSTGSGSPKRTEEPVRRRSPSGKLKNRFSLELNTDREPLICDPRIAGSV